MADKPPQLASRQGVALVVLVLLLLCCCCEGSTGNWSNHWYHPSGFLATGVLRERWVPMNQQEALHYMTPYEVCLLVGTDAGCKNKYPGNLQNKVDSNNMCNAGWQTIVHQDKSCASPAGFLLRYHSQQPWPKTPALVDLVKHMHEHGSNTVILVGDSVSGQMMGDGMCSLERSGVETNHFFWDNAAKYPGFKDGFKVVYEKDPKGVPFFQMLLFEYAPDGPSSARDELNRLQRTLRQNPDFEKSAKGGIVFIMNHGLHFNAADASDNEAGDYAKTITITLQHFLAQTRPEDTLIFRETSAQHFNTPTGLFQGHVSSGFPAISSKPLGVNKTHVATVSQAAARSGIKAIYSSSSVAEASAAAGREEVVQPESVSTDFDFLCQPIVNETMMHRQNWRNLVAKKVIAQFDPNVTRIFIAPFFKATASRHDLHPRDLGDCTHFCSAPMLWAPLWEAVVHLYHHARRGGGKVTAQA